MRLRSLEIQGFKSFPDRTRLTFGDGITAVVGPNGSGKSNIADAVRWVLGEQSTRTLRGGKMEDVIFGGTQSRRPQGYAAVQLTIDNADRALPCDSEEVTVSRRLYRSGESEYRINAAAVRLKDVYELFMDTGLGRDGYSIIGQGRIAEIVGAKSTQRREIFEEAAGISRYRYRRLEAQRRLDGAEENLLRLRDILSELEGRVEPLRAQAEKAARFLEYAQEKKTLEISLWVETLDRSKEVLRGQEDRILLCRNEHGEIQAELDGIEEQTAALFARMQALAVEIDSRRASTRETEELSAQSVAEIAVMRNDMEHNAASVERVREELAQSDVSDGELDGRIAAYEEEISARERELEALRTLRAGTEEQAAGLERRRSDCLTRVEGLKERRYGLTQSIQEVKLSSASSGSLIDETITRLDTLREGAAIKDGNILRVERELEDCAGLLSEIDGSIQSLQNARAGHRLKLEGRRSRLDGLLARRRELEDQARAHEQRARLLFDMENSMEGFQNSVKYIMSQVRKGALGDVCGPVSRLLTVDDSYALAIEIALGAAMQNIVVKDEGVAKRAIGMLKSSKAGRATFLPVSTVRGSRLTDGWLAGAEGFIGVASDLVGCEERFRGVVDQLLGRIAVVRDLDCAAALAKRGNHRFRVVTLDGQVVNTGGSMTGGFAARSAGILSRSKEIETLRARAKDCGAQIAALDVQIKALQEEISAVCAAAAGVDGELATAQEDKIRYAAEQKQLTIAHADAQRVKELAAREYGQLTARLEELKSQNVSSAGLTADLEAQLAEVAEKLSALGDERDALSREAEEVSAGLGEQNIRAVTLTKEADGLRRMAAQLLGQKQDQRAQAAGLERQMADYAARNESIRERIGEAERLREEYAARIAALGAEIAERTARRNACEAESSALRAGERGITARRETAARELARLEEKRASTQAEYDGIISRLWDEYEITRSQAAELARPVEDGGRAQRRLAELKSRIKGLGSVNVGAVEEYREVSERYNFLREQTDDAEKSRAELLRLINQLTGDMREIFLDSFKKIADNFSEIFVELFDGGRAELSLTDPMDVLDSGIEIHVQPPGKIIKNLAALSGGEQAFVAIAIYFAILKVRPSPFCLLDEIEAALDDVNVVKYAQYLRTICGKTQFITITHRRGTMEEADVLYGVTMQEEGVSKLLELHVSEIESKLGMK